MIDPIDPEVFHKENKEDKSSSNEVTLKLRLRSEWDDSGKSVSQRDDDEPTLAVK